MNEQGWEELDRYLEERKQQKEQKQGSREEFEEQEKERHRKFPETIKNTIEPVVDEFRGRVESIDYRGMRYRTPTDAFPRVEVTIFIDKFDVASSGNLDGVINPRMLRFLPPTSDNKTRVVEVSAEVVGNTFKPQGDGELKDTIHIDELDKDRVRGVLTGFLKRYNNDSE